jgi:hypothetical protein
MFALFTERMRVGYHRGRDRVRDPAGFPGETASPEQAIEGLRDDAAIEPGACREGVEGVRASAAAFIDAH